MGGSFGYGSGDLLLLRFAAQTTSVSRFGEKGVPRPRASCRFPAEAKRKTEDRHPFRRITGYSPPHGDGCATAQPNPRRHLTFAPRRHGSRITGSPLRAAPASGIV